MFLVKVHNEAGVTAELARHQPQRRAALHALDRQPRAASRRSSRTTCADRWMDVDDVRRAAAQRKRSRAWRSNTASSQLYSRDAGKREAKLAFDVGQGTQDLGFRNEVNVLFDCEPAVEVMLDVLDDDGKPTTGQFVIPRHAGPRLSARSRAGWRPTSSSTTRSIATTAKTCCCRRASTT